MPDKMEFRILHKHNMPIFNPLTMKSIDAPAKFLGYQLKPIVKLV